VFCLAAFSIWAGELGARNLVRDAPETTLTVVWNLSMLKVRNTSKVPRLSLITFYVQETCVCDHYAVKVSLIIIPACLTLGYMRCSIKVVFIR
jgi:hypothetical protein